LEDHSEVSYLDRLNAAGNQVESRGFTNNLGIHVDSANRQLQSIRAVDKAEINEIEAVDTVHVDRVDLDCVCPGIFVNVWIVSFVLEELISNQRNG
jgi:hypothetical protein